MADHSKGECPDDSSLGMLVRNVSSCRAAKSSEHNESDRRNCLPLHRCLSAKATRSLLRWTNQIRLSRWRRGDHAVTTPCGSGACQYVMGRMTCGKSPMLYDRRRSSHFIFSSFTRQFSHLKINLTKVGEKPCGKLLCIRKVELDSPHPLENKSVDFEKNRPQNSFI